MDLFTDKPPKVKVKQKLFVGEDVYKKDQVTTEKQNATPSKIKTQPTSKSRITQSVTNRSSSTPFIKISVPMRAQSAERKRPNTTSLKSSSAPSSPFRRPTVPSPPTSKPSTPPSFVFSRPTTPVCDGIAEKQNHSKLAFGGRAIDELCTTMRSLSSSFRSESFDCVNKKDRPVRSTSFDPILKNTTKAVSERKRSSLTGRNTFEQSENSSLAQGAHSRVVDQHRWPAMKGGKVSTMAFSRSMNLTDRFEKAASLMLQSRGLSLNKRIPTSAGNSKSIHKSSNEVTQKTNLESTAKVKHNLNYVVNVTSSHIKEEKAIPSANLSRTSSLPTVALRRPPSPNASVLSSSASKRTPSTSISRPSSPFLPSNSTMNQIGTSSSIPSRILDIRKGINGADMEDIHQLRLLYNRELQWCFINSQAKVVLATQKVAVKNIFSNVWNVASELQDYVTMEKINIESLKQEMKLEVLLKEQAPYLEDWIALEGEYSTSLFGTIEALKASMLRLPVTSGARVDLRAVKNAVSSAIDILQAMGSSVCSLLSRQVEGTKLLFCQLASVATKEKAMLDECRVLLAATAGMQVEECSLRAHILQQFRQDMNILG